MDQEILNFIGKIVAYGGGSAAVAFLFFRFLGQQWIEGKFAEKLEAYKHAQSKELEEVKFKINSIFNRVIKMHDKEFEVLPNAWEKLNDAYGPVWQCVCGFREYPNLDNMTNQELEEFLINKKFSDSQKEKLRQSGDKVRRYSEMMTWVEINDARKAYAEFHSYIVKNRIFLSPDIKQKFATIDDLMWKMWVNVKVGQQSGNPNMGLQDFEKNNNEIKLLMQQIEDLVQCRLNPIQAEK